MRNIALLATASILLASGAFAQVVKPSGDVPPPPGINDPGVKATPPPATLPSRRQPALPSMRETGGSAPGRQMSLPEVSEHKEGENEVQEYRRNGLLYMVVVTPKNGITQTYMVSPDGTRHMQPGQPPVQPVMYDVLKWGKHTPASKDTGDKSPGNEGH